MPDTNEFVLRDKGARHGTYIMHNRVPERGQVVIQDQDVISFGGQMHLACDGECFSNPHVYVFTDAHWPTDSVAELVKQARGRPTPTSDAQRPMHGTHAGAWPLPPAHAQSVEKLASRTGRRKRVRDQLDELMSPDIPKAIRQRAERLAEIEIHIQVRETNLLTAYACLTRVLKTTGGGGPPSLASIASDVMMEDAALSQSMLNGTRMDGWLKASRIEPKRKLLEGWIDAASVEQGVTCAICMEIMCYPHSLSCGHAFCARCISEAFVHHVRCPVCRKTPLCPPAPAFQLKEVADMAAKALDRETQLRREMQPASVVGFPCQRSQSNPFGLNTTLFTWLPVPNEIYDRIRRLVILWRSGAFNGNQSAGAGT